MNRRMLWAGTNDLPTKEKKKLGRKLNPLLQLRGEDRLKNLFQSSLDNNEQWLDFTYTEVLSLVDLRNKIDEIDGSGNGRKASSQHIESNEKLYAEFVNHIVREMLEILKEERPIGLITPEAIFFSYQNNGGKLTISKLGIPDAEIDTTVTLPDWANDTNFSNSKLSPFQINDDSRQYYSQPTTDRKQFDREYAIHLFYWLVTGSTEIPDVMDLDSSKSANSFLTKCISLRADPARLLTEKFPKVDFHSLEHSKTKRNFLLPTVFGGLFTLLAATLLFLLLPRFDIENPEPIESLCPNCSSESPLQEYLKQQSAVVDQFNIPYASLFSSIDSASANAWLVSKTSNDGQEGLADVLRKQGALLLQQTGLFCKEIHALDSKENSGTTTLSDSSEEYQCLQKEKKRLLTAMRVHFIAISAYHSSDAKFELLKPSAEPLAKSISMMAELPEGWKTEILEDEFPGIAQVFGDLSLLLPGQSQGENK